MAMSTLLSAQNSLTVRRLRNGDLLYISFDVDGMLYQGVDPTTGKITPDWGTTDQPTITPKVASMRGNGVTLKNMAWKYVGTTLSFTGATSGNWVKDSTGKFQMNVSTGALKIIANLASTSNVANDTLEFSCTATTGGVDYSVARSIDVVIQNIGATSYYGLITASTTQLSTDTTTSTLTAQLLLSGEKVTGFYTRWLKDDTEWKAKSKATSQTVTRDDVDGTQLFIVEFYEKEADTTPVYRAGINIIDTLDDYIVNLAITSTNKEVDTGQPITVTATLINARTNAAVTPDGAVWSLKVMSKDSWEILKSSDTNTIEVTTAETDRNDVQSDVEVVAEVSW
jgi:hypothetical protein